MYRVWSQDDGKRRKLIKLCNNERLPIVPYEQFGRNRLRETAEVDEPMTSRPESEYLYARGITHLSF